MFFSFFECRLARWSHARAAEVVGAQRGCRTRGPLLSAGQRSRARQAETL